MLEVKSRSNPCMQAPFRDHSVRRRESTATEEQSVCSRCRSVEMMQRQEDAVSLRRVCWGGRVPLTGLLRRPCPSVPLTGLLRAEICPAHLFLPGHSTAHSAPNGHSESVRANERMAGATPRYDQTRARENAKIIKIPMALSLSGNSIAFCHIG